MTSEEWLSFVLAYCDAGGGPLSSDEETALRDVLARLEAAEADTRRLNWAETHAHELIVDLEIGDHATVRATIDAARAENDAAEQGVAT